MKKQTGFVLVSVLIITTITTMLAFSQINDNRLQEQIAGNQQKEVNARLAAEKGVFTAFEYIKTQLTNGIPSTYILDNLKKLEGAKVASGNGYYSFPAGTFKLQGNTFTVLSKGEFFGATAYLKTDIVAGEKNSGSFFNEAVMGCDGVTLGGNGVIDSYTYDSDTNTQIFGKNANVATVNAGADIVLSGAATIKGSVTATGKVDADQSSGTSIDGNITAAEEVQLKGTTIAGDIHTGGRLTIKDNITLSGSSSVTVGGNIEGTTTTATFIGDVTQVIYGGEDKTGVFPDGLTAGIIPPDIDFGECDPLAIVDPVNTVDSNGNGSIDADELVYTKGIAAVMSNIETEITTNSLPVASSPMALGNKFKFTEDALFVDDSAVAEASISATTLNALGKDTGMGGVNNTSKVLIIDGNLDMTSKNIVIDGDVTLVVMGDITTKSTNFSFADASNPGSLTIITDGKMKVDTNTVLFSDKSVNAQGRPPLTVFSSNTDGSKAIEVNANGAMYAKLYAPLGGLTLGGGGEIMGAVRGKAIEVLAGTDIHFDEALQGLNDGGQAELQPPVYSSIYYHYGTE